MLTLNQIVSQITNLAAAHNQIAESGVGDFAEWQAKERSYPILWVFHESTSVNQMEITFSIRLICADRVIVGEEGDNTEGHEQEVLSDTLLVLLDFLAYFQQNHSQPYNVVTSATIDPFTERLNDRLAGNSVTIQIRQPFDWNKCQIPQSGASIPPSVDGITLYNFCDPAVIARLTPAQVACLQSEYALPADITINSAPFGTAPSGSTFDVPVVNNGSNPVGSEQSGEWVIGNSTVTINGTQVGDIVAEDSLPIAVELDGNPSGTWNAGTLTWEVTTPPCANGLLGINGNAGLVSVPSGGTANLEVRQGGVNVGSWDGTRWIVPPCAPATFSIDGTQVDTIASGADLDVTLLLDGVAPPSYTYNAGTDTLNVISPPPSTGWVRPSDWIAIPDLTAADERGYFLVVVFENGYNQLGLTINNLAANINWGDGTNVVSNGSVQTKVYDYATLAGPVSVWPDGRNYKQVLVDITRVGGAITSINWTLATTVNPRGNNNVVDAIFSFPSLTTCALSVAAISGTRGMSLLQRLRVRNTGSVTSWQMGGLNSLQALEWADFEGTIPNDLLATVQVIELATLNITAVNALRMFSPSRIRKVGSITANNLTGAVGSRNIFADCPILEEVGPITMNAATNMQSMFGSSSGCPMLTKVGLITAPNVQVLDSFAIYCYSLEELIFANCAAVTSTSTMVFACVSLINCVMPNLTRGVNFTTTAMGNYGMSNFANSIGTASGAQTITVTGTPYGALLAASDATAVAIRNVMTGKGYTVAN